MRIPKILLSFASACLKGSIGQAVLAVTATIVIYCGYRDVKNYYDKKDAEAKSKAPVIPPAASDSHIEEIKAEEVKPWSEAFHENYSMPVLPPILKEVLAGCPKGYEDAMLASLLTEFGTLCFSKVRAEYLDKTMHSPSLMVVVEAPFGAGKAKFDTLYNVLFKRLIDSDRKKLSLDSDTQIIQNMGINTSQSKFYDVTAANQGVHQLILETEISTVSETLRKPNGLSYEHLRKAFENGDVFQNNKVKGSATGSFPVYLNCVFTGTHDAVEKFIGKEIEGGTASRFIWATIPESGREIASLDLPEGKELEAIRDQIDDWHDCYCYNSIDGSDVACKETIIDLDYVNAALKTWLSSQYDLAQEEGNSARKDIRSRSAAIAFHAAIVVHMLWGNPTAEEKAKRSAVVDLALYVANYCSERFIQKFGTAHNSQRESNRMAEYVPVKENPANEVIVRGIPLSVALEIKKWYQPGVAGHGYKAIAKKWGGAYKLRNAEEVRRFLDNLEKLGY